MTATLTAASQNEDLVTAREAARRLGLTPETLLRWRKQGKIPAVKFNSKVIRFNLAQLAQVLGLEVKPADAAGQARPREASA